MMGGRLAEELFLDTVTTGAGNDIEQATELARKMVCNYGMSKLGPLTFGRQEEQIFLGREISQHRDYSEETARSIDDQVHSFVMQGYDRAKEILTENKDALIRIADALLERETLDGVDIQTLIDGQPLKEKPAPTPPQKDEDEKGEKSEGAEPEKKNVVPQIPPHENPSPA